VGKFNTSYQLLPRSIQDVVVEGGGPRIVSGVPYETNITSTGLTFVWQTDSPGLSKVYYGTTTSYTDSVINNTLTNQHQVAVAGLKSATMYHIRLGTANGVGTTYTNDYLVSTSSLSSTGAINVYFDYPVTTAIAQGENAQTVVIVSKLLSRINAATYSIDCALYSLSGTVGANVASALIAAKSRGVKVRVIGEADNSSTSPWTTLSNNSVPLIFDTFDPVNAGAGLMHNKFFVFDNQDSTSDTDDWVWSGSWNATDPGNNDDAQNVIEIQDKALANAYTTEFNEMWGSATGTPNAATSRFGAHKLDNTPHLFVVNGTPIESYFSPSDGTTSKIIKTLSKATNDINFSLLTFTRSDIANVLIAKYKAGIKVHGVMDNRTDQGSVFDTLVASGVDLHLKGSAVRGLYHHKYGLVDAETAHLQQYVITGSHNWSSSAENSNNENTLIIQSKRIANLYLQEFAARYAEAGGTDNITVNVSRTGDNIPRTTSLSQNFPNPFNPTTNFELRIAKSGFVSVKVFDLLGREVATLVNENKSPGVYVISWDASKLATGMYLYKMQTGGLEQTKKMLLVR
jgi:HKD family nuclease